MKDKVAIITGGASGFGAAMVEHFLAEGAHVIAADLDPAPKGHYVRCDVTSRADIDALAQTAMERFGRIDILVNNAGISHPPQPLDEISLETFDAIFRVNMKSIYLTSQVVVPLMKAAKSGTILNIASTLGVRSRPGLSWYGASKGWVINATRSMAVELAPFGIRVNALNPALAETPMMATFLTNDTPQVREALLKDIPAGKFIQSSDVANAAVFMCKDSAEMITGVCMEVDGGRCI